MSGPGGPINYDYASNGWLIGRTHTTASTIYSYNDLGMLTYQESSIIIPSDILEVHFTDFKYDGAFNLKEVQQTFQQYSAFSGLNKWTYDTKNRLTRDESAKAGGFDHSFAYDGASNPTTFKGSARTFNAANQRTGSGFVYDGNGNPTTYAGNAVTYDVENRVSSIGTVTNGYRSDGMRAWKQVGSGSKTYFLYDGGNPIIEMNASGTVTAINAFGPDGLVARQSGGNWTYYTFDQQGNVAVRQSADGTITSRSTFDAYGQEFSTGTPSDPYAYNGQWGYYLDRETGLYLCQHRYYDPSNGRWLNRDPIGYAGGANLYGYCGQRPVNSIDVTGLVSVALNPMGAVAMAEATTGVVIGVGAAGAAGGTATSSGLGTIAWAFLAGLTAAGAISLALPSAAECEETEAQRKRREVRIYRRGSDFESASRLDRKSKEAESTLGIHGVSGTVTRSATDPWSTLGELEGRGFKVHPTPSRSDPGHVTIELPDPVTEGDAQSFNDAFGRRRGRGRGVPRMP